MFPILYGSALRQIGMAQLLDAVIDYLPSPLDRGDVEGKNPVTGEVEKRAAEHADAPFSAYVFKTIIDPFAGKLSVLRVISGKIDSGRDLLRCQQAGAKRKSAICFASKARNRRRSKRPLAGEIVAVAKFKDIATGDTLCDEKAPIQYDRTDDISRRVISFALEPKSKADEDKLPQGLHRMMEEDQTIELASRRGNPRFYSFRHGPAAYRNRSSKN